MLRAAPSFTDQVLKVVLWLQEGFVGFYRGWAANTLKVVPQNAIRFVAYEQIKHMFGVTKASSDT